MRKFIQYAKTVLVFQALLSHFAIADISEECRGVSNWTECKELWERVGLSEDRLRLAVDLSADAYLVYDQFINQQESDLTKPLIIKGQVKANPKRNYDGIFSQEGPKNVIIFNGVTGSYGQRSKTPMGFVAYQPSELEIMIHVFPELLKQKSLKELAEKYSTKRLISVAFRGTRHHWYDLLLTDFSARQVLAPDYMGHSPNKSIFAKMFKDVPRVHGGFLATFESSFPEISKAMRYFLYERVVAIKDLDSETAEKLIKNTEVLVTGHSLGGALAQIGGFVLGQRPDLSPNKPTVITFNQPHVGNEKFNHSMDDLGVAYFRIHRKTDIVTKVLGYVTPPSPHLISNVKEVHRYKLNLISQVLPKTYQKKISKWIPSEAKDESFYHHGGESLYLEDVAGGKERIWDLSMIIPRHSLHQMTQEIDHFIAEHD